MFTYICIGLLFAWIMELAIHNKWNPKVPSYQRIHFNTFERLVMIVLWPIWLVRMIHDKLNKHKYNKANFIWINNK